MSEQCFESLLKLLAMEMAATLEGLHHSSASMKKTTKISLLSLLSPQRAEVLRAHRQ